MGNHTWKNPEIIKVFACYDQVLRPANYPPETPGEGFGFFRARNGYQVGILNLLGQVYIDPPLSCPFQVGKELLEYMREKTPFLLVDFHAEATSEKMAFANYVADLASTVVGTHTHITTADERILPGGTGYITDVGMCGPVNSVLGIKTELAVRKFLTKLPVRFAVASGRAELNGLLVEWDGQGRTVLVERVNRREG